MRTEPPFTDILFRGNKRDAIPSSIGVYIFKHNHRILYVGKSVNLRARIASHFENSKIDSKEKAIIENANSISYTICDSEFRALLLESRLIKHYQPKFNARWKDDKSYLYIKITVKDPYPKIYPARKEKEDGNLYFGPFPSLSSVEEMLGEIRRIFPFCAQKNIGRGSCFYSKINLCSPCPNFIVHQATGHEQSALKRTYRTNIRQIVKILKGQTESVLKLLYRKLKSYTKEERFEEAIDIRDRIFRFENLLKEKTFHHEEIMFNRSQLALARLTTLLKPYYPHLKNLNRIECYDISNLSFSDSTASMTVLTKGVVDKSSYRRFRIKKSLPRSDFEMIEEVLVRRFRNRWPRPELVVIDGGKPQVKAVNNVLSQLKIKMPVLGIAKNPDRFVIGNDHFFTIKPKFDDLGFIIIRHLRDESHRFARKYHLLLRSKKLI